jgi:deazaflavin-dependent oxidoreductase (nitroreductase family)
MNPLSTAMAAGSKVLDALPKSAQGRAWSAIQISHLTLFRASGRRLGTQLGRVRVLFLHHRGAKTGRERISPLLYVEDGQNLAIIASKGGHVRHPAWFHNLNANPNVEVELKGGVREVHARVAEGAERDRIWKTAASVWPDYDRYQRRAPHRKIPVVVLEPRSVTDEAATVGATAQDR